MEITISVSERAEQKIREQAASNGKDVSEFVGEFVEENFANGNANQSNGQKQDINNQKDEEKDDYENPFEPFLGMFSSGKTDTSERMHEILYSEDFDSAEGFSIREKK